MKRFAKFFGWIFAIGTIAVIAVLVVGNITNFIYKESYPKTYSAYVTKYSQEYNIDENLVYAVIRSESGFNPDAVSEVDAKGLMQITEDTFNWAHSRMENPDDVTYDNIFDPEVNIRYGVYILRLLLDEFQSEGTTIAAYHAGWGVVKGWLENSEYSSNGIDIESIPGTKTNSYVSTVLKAKENYEKIYSEETLLWKTKRAMEVY